MSETQKAHCPIDAMKKRRRRRKRRRQGRARAQAQVAQPSAHDLNSHCDTSKSDNSSNDVELRSRDAVESRTELLSLMPCPVTIKLLSRLRV